MRVSVGTFNLNNLFSRYNFEAEIDAVQESSTVESETLYRFGTEDVFKVRRYKGRLVKAKDPEGTRLIANVAGCKPSEVRVGMRVQAKIELVDDQMKLPVFYVTK